jgi:hypothetical protein
VKRKKETEFEEKRREIAKIMHGSHEIGDV